MQASGQNKRQRRRNRSAPLPCLPARPQKPGVQAALTLDDVLECESALKRNARFRALMAERYGIADVEAVAVDPWYRWVVCRAEIVGSGKSLVGVW